MHRVKGPVKCGALCDSLCPCHIELEWKLSESGAVKTDLEENPKKPIGDKLLSLVRDSVPTRRDSDSD
jgi:hypothetical protein